MNVFLFVHFCVYVIESKRYLSIGSNLSIFHICCVPFASVSISFIYTLEMLLMLLLFLFFLMVLSFNVTVHVFKICVFLINVCLHIIACLLATLFAFIKRIN